MTRIRIAVGCLYPNLMSVHGDRGNVETIRRRCGWRGIDADITQLRLGDRLPPDLDLIMIGGGGEAQQRLVAPDLYKVKGAAIREAVAAGTAALAVGGGYELFGRFCQPEFGAEYRGVELFDCWTVRRRTVRDADDSISGASAERFTGELVASWGASLLVGFENHSGGIHLGPNAQPLGRVLAGHGNNGDGTEGVILGSAVGTNLRGPCLPKNPALADFLISAAVSRRYPDADLAHLADDLEQAARTVAVERARQATRTSRPQVSRLLPHGPLTRRTRLTRQRQYVRESAAAGRRPG